MVAETARQALEECGINPERFSLEWASAAEAPRFVELVTGFVNSVKALGPLGTAEGEASRDVIGERMDAAVEALNSPKVRTSLGNVAKGLKKTNDYSPENIKELVGGKVIPALRKERVSRQLMTALAKGGAALSDLAGRIGAPEDDVQSALDALVKKGKVEEKAGSYILAG